MRKPGRRTLPTAIVLAASLPAAGAAQVVHGSAFDALLSRAPLAGAEVWSATGNVTTRTDSAGRFALTLPGPGEHVLVLHHPLLEEMRLPAPRARVRVAEGDTVTVALDLPDADGMARLLCGDAIAPGSVIVLGQLIDRGAVVRDPASRVIVRTSRRGTRGGRATDGPTFEARWEDGHYRVCDIPAGHDLEIVASVPGAAPLVRRERASLERVLVRHLPVARGALRAAPSWRLRGRLVSRAGTPIAGARLRLEVAGEVMERASDQDGAFALRGWQGERGRLHVAALGFAEAEIELPITDGTMEPIVLEAAAVALPASRVVARAERPRERGSTGWVATREDIERQRPRRISEVVARAPGMRLTTDGTVYAQRTLTIMGSGGCPPRYFLNGHPTPFASTLEPMIDVERIEVYTALGTIPEQYRGWGAGCGVVLVWSR